MAIAPRAFAFLALAAIPRSAALRVSADTIPSVIHFTGPWEPISVVNQSRAVVQKGTEFRYYDYSALERSVREISASLDAVGVHGASEAFHELRPHAFRVDLWRLMVLWQHGGIYIDAKMALRAPVSAWVDQARDSFAACYDVDVRESGRYWNAMLAARKHNPTLLTVIKRIISNVQEHWYPASSAVYPGVLDITGPGVLTSVLRGEPATARPRVRCQMRQQGKTKHMEVRSTMSQDVVAAADDSEHEAMRACEDCESYQDLYGKHEVYCGEPGPECKFSASEAAVPYLSHVV